MAVNALVEHCEELHTMKANEENELSVRDFPYCDDERNGHNADGYLEEKADESKMREMALITCHGVFHEQDDAEGQSRQIVSLSWVLRPKSNEIETHILGKRDDTSEVTQDAVSLQCVTEIANTLAEPRRTVLGDHGTDFRDADLKQRVFGRPGPDVRKLCQLKMILKAFYGLRGSPKWLQDVLVDSLTNILNLLQYEPDSAILKSKDGEMHLSKCVDDPFATSRELNVAQNFLDNLDKDLTMRNEDTMG
eukprot:6578569-Alexandrium_andersonii.AAC.1